MNEIKLLIVDDDINAIKSIKATIRSYERQADKLVTYRVYKAQNFAYAVKKIKYYKIDTAIIDLNLDPNVSDNTDGNNIIHEFINQSRIPIFVVSGTPEKLASDFENNNLIKVFTRDHDVNEKIIEREIPRIMLSKTIEYFARDGYLEKEINDFYWNNLQETLNTWNDVAQENPTEIDKILSRHTVACLNEKLYVNGNIGHFDKYHSGEMYILPPIKQHYHTGDLISRNNELFIILNPACDIVNKGKLNNYTLAKIIKALDIPKIKDKSEANKISYINDNLKRTNALDQYHFLPSFNKIAGDFVIDFQQLTTVEIGTENKSIFNEYIIEREKHITTYERVASISSPFLKDIISRFSLYYARQGQPNLL